MRLFGPKLVILLIFIEICGNKRLWAKGEANCATRLAVAFRSEVSISTGEGLSPSSSKPKLFVQRLFEAGIPVRLIPVDALTKQDLYRVHDPRFVDGILEGRIENGFGNFDSRVARSCLFTSGSLYCAALDALDSGMACSPTSGFHHAGWRDSGAFCTFNGLMAVSVKLRQDTQVRRIAIIDADYHWGNGTDEILDHFEMRDFIFHYSFGKEFSHPEQVSDYFFKLKSLEAELKIFSPDIILYQAGADVHLDDPRGGLMTALEIQARDTLMFEIARRLAVPIVWNLAGGYQQDRDGSIAKVLDIHENTARAAVSGVKE